MKIILTIGAIFLMLTASGQNNIGINTTNPLFSLDIQSLSDTSPANFQLSTPSSNHFMRIFAGHDNDPKPFLLFNQLDTFRIAHSGPDYESFTEQFTVVPGVGIGIFKSNPEAKLDLLGGDWDLDSGQPGDLRIGTSMYNLRVGVATGGGGAGTVRMYSQGGDFLLGANNSSHFVIDTGGNIGIDSYDPTGKLHIKAQSTIDFPQLRLTQTENDYARIKFENTAFPNSFWDIAARGGSDTSGVRQLNIYYEQDNIGTDIVRLSPQGILAYNTRNTFFSTNYYTDYVHRAQFYVDSTQVWLRTLNTSDNKIYFGTKSHKDIAIDTNGYVGINKIAPEDKLHVGGYIRSDSLAGTGNRNLIVDANGRLTTGGFVYADLDEDTHVQVEASPDEDKIRFTLGGIERWVMDSARLESRNSGRSIFIGEGAGAHDNLSQNVNIAIGSGALYNNVDGHSLIAIGDSTLFNLQGSEEEFEAEANLAIGYRALYANTIGYDNTAVGFQTLTSNTTGYYNSAFGRGALVSNTTGANNTAIGGNTLVQNSKGNSNVAIGYNALTANQEGSSNCAVGNLTLYFNTFGNQNTALGKSALFSNIEGGNNVAIGFESLLNNENGGDNVAVGTHALNNTIASQNVGVGTSSLYYNSTGFQNTAVGDHAQASNINIYNSTALGAYTDCTADNQVRIGNSSVTSIGGYANWTNISDGRFKDHVQEDVHGLDFINQLRPVTYTLSIHDLESHWKDHFESPASGDWPGKYQKEHIRYSGFIAQEVEQAAINSGYDFSGVDAPEGEDELYGLRYAEFVVPLVKAIQEQQEMILALQKQVAELQSEMEKSK